MRFEYVLFMLMAFLVGCLASRKELTDEEKAKLDSGLLQMVMEQNSGASAQTASQMVHVIIHTSDIEALKKLGIELQTTHDRFATARVRIGQLRQLLALPTVQFIELGSTNRPQK